MMCHTFGELKWYVMPLWAILGAFWTQKYWKFVFTTPLNSPWISNIVWCVTLLKAKMAFYAILGHFRVILDPKTYRKKYFWPHHRICHEFLILFDVSHFWKPKWPFTPFWDLFGPFWTPKNTEKWFLTT